MESCGCDRPLRRVCDLCRGARYAFATCTNACLEAHQAKVHGETGARSTERRLRDALRAANRRDPGNWERYSDHRRRVLDGLGVDGHGDDIAVFGAGACADIDLEHLCENFERVHLVDLDGEVIERARDRLPLRARERTVLHGDIDLSGFLDRIDAWGEGFPAATELGAFGVAAAQGIAARLGGPFRRTLSTCVLSQLIVPYQRTLLTSAQNWEQLGAALVAVHLITLALATRAGGACFMAFDVLSSDSAPSLRELRGELTDEQVRQILAQASSAGVEPTPEPAALVALLSAPVLAAAVTSPRLSSPWLWEIAADSVQLVYGLSFARR
ncbi:MAG TPA: hypothetical protein VNN72_00595 [Polyangiaceae bacterium]|nr:hypothetical protein [Polyangiaceae bacterium]